MNENLKKRLKRTALLSIAAAVIGAGIGLYQVNNDTAQVVNVGPQAGESAEVPGSQVGGSFSLTDHTGKAVTEKDYDQNYKIVYFGFTFCPMICPTELQKIAQVLNTLGDQGANIQPLFISVDPERDTPDVMAQYVVQFHPRLVGLTGTKEQTEAAKESFKVFAQKTKDEKMEDYTVDHSSFIYLMSPDNRLVAIYRTEDTADFIASDIRGKISS